MKLSNKNLLCITGPTASGKSAATAAIANRWPIEIINVDSASIYKDMDIGTAKPSEEERSLVHHHLLDIRDPSESYSAAQFRTDVIKLVYEIKARGNTPVLCGGTMLYYKALKEGLSQLPSADMAVRQRIDEEAKLKGWPAMHKLLESFDPNAAKRLAPNDSQRIQRAIEIYLSTGKTMTQWIMENPPEPGHDMNLIFLSLEPKERSELHNRIAHRYRSMIEMGLVEEVKKLYKRGDLNINMPSIRCVGYRQIWQHIQGDYNLETAIERAIAATRQLAKRQLTWLRSYPERNVINCLGDNVEAKVINFASTFMKNK